MTRRSTLAPAGWPAVLRRAEEIANEIISTGLRPTLRSIFYRLSSEGLLVHSQTAYKKLSEKFARYREERQIISILEDRTRYEVGTNTREPQNILDYIRLQINFLLRRLEEDVWKVPKWHQQRSYVEIFVEKDALADLLSNIAYEEEVLVFVTRGFSSITKLYEASLRLKEFADRGNEIVVLTLTDFDPSGLEIENDYKAKLEKYGVSAKFHRIALKPEQISKYDLPAIPEDDPSYARIKRDPRFQKWKKYCEEHRIEPKPVELDAFVGLRPQEFKNEVISAIRKYFDENIYREVKKIEEERRKLAKQYVDLIRNYFREILM